MSASIWRSWATGQHGAQSAGGLVTPLPRYDLAPFIEPGVLPPAELERAILIVADKSFDETHATALTTVLAADTVREEIEDARSTLRATERERWHTLRYNRVKQEAEAEPAPVTGHRKWAAQASAIIVGLYLLASIGLLDFTVANVILINRVFPAVGRDLLLALFLCGAVLSGMLLTPLTLSWATGSGRLRMLALAIANALAMGCAVWFLADLWFLSAVHSQVVHAAATGTDYRSLSDEEFRLRSAMQLLAVVGESMGALAVKFNLDALHGTHLKYRRVVNCEWVMADEAVTDARRKLAVVRSRYDALFQLNHLLTLARDDHRNKCRLHVRAEQAKAYARINSGVRSVWDETRRNPRDFE